MNLEMQKGFRKELSRRKLPAFFFATAVGLGMAWYLLADVNKDSEATSFLRQGAEESLAHVADMEDDPVDLAIKTISLSQGEGGFELWRLKAEWANLRKRDDNIIVEEPRLTYNMREEGKVLFVESRTGDINQKEQILRFIDDVSATQESKHITGPLLVYNGRDKTMTFPHGCKFKDMGVFGSADTLVWHIDRQVIEGNGNVKVLLDGQRSAFSHTTVPVQNSQNSQSAPASSKETP